MSSVPTLTLRPASAEDDAVLVRLARLDSTVPLAGVILIAERDGAPLAAMSLTSGRIVADPFSPTADLVELLQLRAACRSRTVRLRTPSLRRRTATA